MDIFRSPVLDKTQGTAEEENLVKVGEGRGQVQWKRVSQGRDRESTWVKTESQSEAGQGTRDYEEMKSGWSNGLKGMREDRAWRYGNLGFNFTPL